MAHFHIENLTFSYPGTERKTLDKICLDIHPGEYVVLCGQSGSGKTTLLRHLKTVLRPHGTCEGSVSFLGKPLDSFLLKEQAQSIGFVMQNPDDQIVTDKVWHELAFGLESIGVDPKVMRLRVAEMASYFGIQSWFHRNVGELSGGQKQLLNLASIMAMHPEVLILDEPTSQLDPIAASDFLNTVKKINIELGTTVIITEHRLEDIYHAADRIIVMDQGKVIANDTPRKVGHILWQTNSEMFAALPTPVRIFYESGSSDVCPLTVREGRNWLTNAFSGSQLRYTYPEEKQRMLHESASALKIRDAWFRYEKDGADILKDLSFEVPSGCLYAIVGGNGSGKSTTLKAIAGIHKLYRGKIEIFGKPLGKYRRGELFQNCISMLPQDPKSLFVTGSVKEELLEMNTNSSAVNEAAQLCGIEQLMDSHPHDLSGGEQQRVALAKVLLTHPKLLLLDEPTKGLDNFFKQKFAELLRRLISQGITIVMVSHDVEFCAEHADLVSMFFDGQIVTTDSPQAFFGQNSFYTTAANRMSRCLFKNAVNASDVLELYRRNKGACL